MKEKNETVPLAGYGKGGGRGRGFGRGQRWMGDYSLIDVRLVEPALLTFLRHESLHGYGLLEKLAELGLGSINPSLVYRILRDYEELGLVQSDWDKDTTFGPPKRVYTLTKDGEIALSRMTTSLKDTVSRIESLLLMIEQSEF